MPKIIPPAIPSFQPLPASGHDLLTRMLSGMTTAAFHEQHMLQHPLLRRGSAMELTGLISDALLDALLSAPCCDVVVAQGGQVGERERPRSLAEAARLHGQGYSCIYRHVERWSLDLAGYSTLMTEAIPGIPDLHIHRTPAGTYGFGWHCDPEEVFLVQTSGRMRYLVRANTVHPAPTGCSMPPAGAWESETSPILSFELSAGDWLYIPGGWWHVGLAIDDSTTLSLGIRIFARIDLLRATVNTLARSVAWRRRLKSVHPSAPGSVDTCQALLRKFAEAIRRTADDPQAIADILRAHGRPGSGLRLRTGAVIPADHRESRSSSTQLQASAARS